MQKISLILLLRNGAKYLGKLLPALDSQLGDYTWELVVVDNASGDEGVGLIEKFNGEKIKQKKIIHVKREDFRHGGTRNMAVQKTTGEIVVLLSQDALPFDKHWLQNLLKHFKNPLVAGVFGRQIPWEETNQIEKYFYAISYPSERRILDQNSDLDFSHQNLFFSNVNAAVKRDLLLKCPFPTDLVMSEDQYWAREMIKQGFQIVYEPKAQVWHSHNYNIFSLAQRYFLTGRSQKQLNLKGKQMQKGIGTGLELIKYLIFNRPLLLPYSFLYLSVKGVAYLLGKNFSR